MVARRHSDRGGGQAREARWLPRLIPARCTDSRTLVRLFTRRRSRGPRLGRPYKSSLQSVGRTEHCANRELRLAAPAISLR